jgi:peptidoglycan pentaglycine glycine transferase (the first glycine)
MNPRVDTKVPDQEWNQFVSAHPAGHVLQTSAWGSLKSEFGWQAKRIAVWDGAKIVSGAQVLYRRLAPGIKLAYVPKGPVIDFGSAQACQVLFEALHGMNRSQHVMMLKIEPDLLEQEQMASVLARYGFQSSPHSIQPRRTVLVDVTPGEDEVLSRMKSKTRYNIRLSGRKGVRIHEGKEADLSAFNQLMAVTGERNEFGVHSSAYYERAYELFAPLGMARLLLATYDDQPIGGVMTLACGTKAWNMFSASADEHREKMPNYALQWEAMRWAKERGCQTYDLWGIPDAEEEMLEAQFAQRSDGLWGLYRFKRGFGGQVVRYVGSYDYVYVKPLYWLYRMALRLR